MKRIMSGSLLALLTLILVGAMASAASAEEFIYSKTGKLESKALGIQTFTLKSGGPTIECNQLSSKGEVTALKATTLGISILYGKCTALGGSEEAIVSLATFKFSTNPRSVAIVHSEPEPPPSIFNRRDRQMSFRDQNTSDFLQNW